MQHHPPSPAAPLARQPSQRTWQWLRAVRVRRVIVAVVLMALVPVLNASVSCQIDCALQSADGASGGDVQDDHVSGDAAHAVPANQSAEHLKHGGPCHLAAVPALVHRATGNLSSMTSKLWAPDAAKRYRSCAWPPPEHRPRAATLRSST